MDLFNLTEYLNARIDNYRFFVQYDGETFLPYIKINDENGVHFGSIKTYYVSSNQVILDLFSPDYTVIKTRVF